MFITDSHIHLNSDVFKGKLSDFLHECAMQNIGRLIVPSITLEEENISIDANGVEVVFSRGVHPYYADRYDTTNFHDYNFDSCASVGEIGLDFRKEIIDKVPAETQIKIFTTQLEIALEKKVPVLLHCVKAHDQMLQIIKQHKFICRGIVHSFSASPEIARRWINEGFKLGIGPLVLNPNSVKLRKTLGAISSKDMLLETDAPFAFSSSADVYVIPYLLRSILLECSVLMKERVDSILNDNEASLKELFKF